MLNALSGQSRFAQFVAVLLRISTLGGAIRPYVRAATPGGSEGSISRDPSRRMAHQLYGLQGPYQYAGNKFAMLEANLTCGNTSRYGVLVPKLPAYLLNQVNKLVRETSDKSVMYNFQGSIFSQEVAKRRQWVIDLLASRSSGHDSLIITDAPEGHRTLGPYDHTNEFKGFRPRAYVSSKMKYQFEQEYWDIMVRSNFTLCPGGDSPWSMRFYEAIVAGSVPVIQSEAQDCESIKSPCSMFNRIGYTYCKADSEACLNMPPRKLKEVTDRNRELFFKYQSFMFGDQVPPAYKQLYRRPCSTDRKCSWECRNRIFN
jgi:hypothetical protein